MDFGIRPEYASDRVVDFLIDHGIEYVALNPGSSFRGLHDSLVNYRPDAPKIIEVTHEKTAVSLAHGYAKATGKPMAVVLHDLVGLMQGTMGIYMAQTDQLPIFVLGGAGPMDEALRRPWIDWVHTANTQNNLVRDFTKWDDHPYSTAAFGPSLARGYRQMMQAPQGPVYIALDAALQEQELSGEELSLSRARALPLPSAIAAAPGELERVIDLMHNAERPVLVPGFIGTLEDAWEPLIELCERYGIGVFESGLRLSFPNRHPLWMTNSSLITEADLVILLDVKDPAHKTGLFKKTDLSQTPQVAPDATIIEIGLNDISRKAWTNHEGLLFTADFTVTAEAGLALSQLVEFSRESVKSVPEKAEWRNRILQQRQHDERIWADRLEATANTCPVSTAQLSKSVWDAIKDYDWVLSAGTANDWVYRTWNFDRPYRHPGRSLGTATQFAMSLGVALANVDTDRLVVSIQPDGDMLYDLGGMWVAAHYRLPLLCVMFNNRSYYNDWAHQAEVARIRSRPEERAWIGMELNDPEPDFSKIAQGFGWFGEGPIDDPRKVSEAVARAARVVVTERRPALVDVVCEVQ